MNVLGRAPLRILLSLTLLPFAARAAEPLDAEAVLSRIQASYTKSPSTHVTFVQSYAPAGFPDSAQETGRLFLQPPDLLRFEYDGADGKVFTFDGKTAHQYVAADSQLVVKSLTAGERSRLPLLFLEAPSTVLTRYTATVKELPSGVIELALAPRVGDEPKEVNLLVGPEGDVKKLALLGSTGDRTTFLFTQKEGGKKLPASDFTLVPPKGTKVVNG
jgi:outer membrane lipoprotein-sorting protein